VSATKQLLQFQCVSFTPEYLDYAFRRGPFHTPDAIPPSSPPNNIDNQKPAVDTDSPTPIHLHSAENNDHAASEYTDEEDDDADDDDDDDEMDDEQIEKDADEEMADALEAPANALPFMTIQAGYEHDLSTANGRIDAAVDFAKLLAWTGN